MGNLTTFSAFTTLTTLLPEIAVFALCAYYYSKRKTMDALLLCIGSGVGLLIGAFFRLLPLIGSEVYDSLMQNGLFTITSTVGFLSSACFAVGLGMLIMNTINQGKK